MDHEGSPVDGEYSSMDARRYADIMEECDMSDDELRCTIAWCKGRGEDFSGEAYRDAEGANHGRYDSDIEFAQELAEELGAVPEHANWPNDCIDWERAARELMMDYFEEDGFYFRA